MAEPTTDESHEDQPNPSNRNSQPEQFCDSDVSAEIHLSIEDRHMVSTLSDTFCSMNVCSVTNMSDRVRYSLDMARIAICDRIARICRNDVPPEEG
jgi:hypothetical protein